MEPTHRIHDFNYDREGDEEFTPHVALVLRGANGQEVLTKKEHRDNEVQITMSMAGFLEKFFYVYGTNAEILAGIMGFEVQDSEGNSPSYDEFIQSKIDSVLVLKGMEIPESAPLTVTDKIIKLQTEYGEAITQKYDDITNTSGDSPDVITSKTHGEDPMDELETALEQIKTLKAEATAKADLQAQEMKTLKGNMQALVDANVAAKREEMVVTIKEYSFIPTDQAEGFADLMVTLKADAQVAVLKHLEGARNAVAAAAMSEEGNEGGDPVITDATGESITEKAADIVSAQIKAAKAARTA